MELASGWYDSATAWSAVGTLVALVSSLFGAWVTVKAARPTRRLLYKIKAVRPLVDAEARLGEHEMVIRPSGTALKRPYILDIELANQGPDISSESYDRDQPLQLEISIPVVKINYATYSRGSRGRVPISLSETALKIGPGLIGRSQKISVSLLVEGSGAVVTCLRPNIVGVDVVPGGVHSKIHLFTPEPASEEGDQASSRRVIFHSTRTRRLVLGVCVSVAIASLISAGNILFRAGNTLPVASLSSWIYTTGGEVESGPAVAAGVVYAGSDDRKLYALDAATGKLLWSYATSGPVDSSPAVASGLVYIGSQGRRVYALNAVTGKLRWSYATIGAVESRPAVAAGIIYLGDDDNNLYALNAATGRVRWVYATGGNITSSPAVMNGIVYVGSDDDKIYALNAASG
jgi:hypothetical protein